MKYNMVYEYLFLANPEQVLSKKITEEKKYYHKKFGEAAHHTGRLSPIRIL